MAGRKRTPDWLVLDGYRLLVVEVKQSALSLATKSLGSLDLLASDLKKTLLVGASQLLKFKTALNEQPAGLERLANIAKIELMMVTHDALPWANSVLREQVAESLPGAEQIHFCSIDDFENLQRYCWGESMFDLLEEKRNRTDNAMAFDFREWLAERGDPGRGDHPALAEAFEDLSSTWKSGATNK